MAERRSTTPPPQYAWNSHVFTVDPTVAGTRIQALARRAQQKLTARMVLDDARPVTSPLHEAFEWTDSTAAEEYRLSQARQMISSLRIVVQRLPPTAPQRLYVNVALSTEPGKKRERYYLPVPMVMAQPNLRSQVLARARAELANFRTKYADFPELASVHAAIDALPDAP